ncbi:MAG: hypothetical protein IJ896_14460 [Fibrobacter sp.]|nr:hypothetical protein [Fibrobacter sp.]
MAEEFDFSALRSYLQGQMDLGDAEVFLDEPWAPKKRMASPAPASAPVPPRPTAHATAVPPSRPASAPYAPTPASATTAANAFVRPDMPAPRAASREAAPFESAVTPQEFYGQISNEKLYAGKTLFRYEGPDHPTLLLLFQTPRSDIPSGGFLKSPVAEMLFRLFTSLNVAPESIGVTFFYKLPESRNFPPLLEAALRKMLAKELSLLAPSTMVTFGEPLFHQVFGKGKNFMESAGTDMEFAGVKTCSLVDAFAMMGDKQLKLLTWKTHLPKCTYFKR